MSVNNTPYTENDLIVFGDSVYTIALYDPSMTEFDMNTAYVWGDYFYTYKGIKDEIHANNLPGIYFNIGSKKYELLEVETKEDREAHLLSSHVRSLDPKQIINMINKDEAIIISVPENSKLFLPQVSKDDDILKRLIKLALIEKGIDIDSYKTRFVDKNALFNFKQVVKGPTRLSMLLFDRGIEALNLKYTIIVEEEDPKHALGIPLKDKIVATSEDTYDI